MLADAQAWRWSRSSESFFFSWISDPKRRQWECRTEHGYLLLRSWQETGKPALGCHCSHTAVAGSHTSLPKGFFLEQLILVSCPLLGTGLCTLKAAISSFPIVSHLCIACMFLKATGRYNVKGKRRRRPEDQGPMDGGHVTLARVPIDAVINQV